MAPSPPRGPWRAGWPAALATAALVVFSPAALASVEAPRYAPACEAWAVHLVGVIDRRLETQTLTPRQAAFLFETVESLRGGCSATTARHACLLLQRVNDYLVDETNQP
jgi:hypothetical protein